VKPLTAVSLFAGVGGIDLALERAGVDVVAAVEIDNAARGVIADRRPGIALFTDVRKVNADALRAAGFVPERGIVAAGWPCQGNSVAGGRGGMADPRSGLWREVVRLLAETRAGWFLGENVPGLLSVNDGDDFGVVVHDLGTLGYGGASRVLDAQFFGVPQRRRRVFLVGCLGDQRRPVEVLAEPEGGGGDPPAGRAPGQGVAATLTRGSSGSGVSAPGRRQEDDVNLVVSTLQGGGRRGHRIDAESAAGGHLIPMTFQKVIRSGERDADGNLPPEVWDTRPVAATLNCGDNTSESRATELIVQAETVVRRLTPRECERLQGFPDDWTATSNGKPQADSARYRQMGNAVAVPCVEWIARRIVGAA